MKTIAKTISILTVIGLVAILATTVVHARGGDPGGMPELTDDERAQVQEIRDGYHGKFEAVRDKLKANNEAMEKLMANDDATVGELKKLRETRATLHKEKRELRGEMRQEVTTKLGVDFSDEGYRGRGGHEQGKKWREEGRHNRRYDKQGDYRQGYRQDYRHDSRQGRYGCDKPCNPQPDCPCPNK